MRPAYITAIRSAICAHDREIVRDVDHRQPGAGRASRPISLEDVRLRRRRRGPSSARRARRPRAGTTSAIAIVDALLLAARELVRVALQECRRRRQVDRRERLADASVGRLVRQVRAEHRRAISSPIRMRRVERHRRAPAARTRRGGRAARRSRALGALGSDSPAISTAPAAIAEPGPRDSRAARARSSSCRCPTRPRARGSRPRSIANETSSTTGSPDTSSSRRSCDPHVGSLIADPGALVDCPRPRAYASATRLTRDRQRAIRTPGTTEAQAWSVRPPRFSEIISAQSAAGGCSPSRGS